MKLLGDTVPSMVPKMLYVMFIYVNENGSSNLIENLSDENEIVNLIVQTIKYFKKRENIMRLERIENDF